MFSLSGINLSTLGKHVSVFTMTLQANKSSCLLKNYFEEITITMESIIIQQQQLFYAQQIQNILTMFVISAFSSSSMNHNRNNKIINFAVWIKKYVIHLHKSLLWAQITTGTMLFYSRDTYFT